MVRPVVHSRKHYVQQSLRTIDASTKEDTTIITAVESTLANVANEVREGAIVKAVYIELWMRTQSTSPGSYILVLSKSSGGAGLFSTAEMAALWSAENKKNILFTSQGLLNDQDADAMTPMRGWYKIPRSKQRFGLGDKLFLQIFAQGALDITACGFELFKEYT